MIFLGLGSNQSSSAGAPLDTLVAARDALREAGCTIKACSPIYESAPVGPADQPWFANSVMAVESDRSPEAMLALCHRVEHAFARRRERRWHARTLDIDLLDWHGTILPDRVVWIREAGRTTAPDSLVLPHPRLHLRRFAMQPLYDIAPDWRHPVLGQGVESLMRAVADQPLRPASSPSALEH